MRQPTIVFWTLLAIAVFAVAARALRRPYPIVMVVGGALLALVPELPTIALRPDTVFYILLPPLLFGAAWRTDFREFREFIGPITTLALGLVVFTTVVVAYGAHWLIGLPLASAFVLGAVLSPPDAIATEAIAEEVPFPRAIAAVLSGESLVNDATALVIYRFAVVAVVTGAFSLAGATLQFLYLCIGGIAIGLVIAELIGRIQTWLRRSSLGNQTISTVLSLVTPYLVYIPAEAAGASGVLAAVAGGIYLSRKSTVLFDSPTRLMANGVWDLLIFMLNGIAFILIGLQLRAIVADLHGFSLSMLAWYGLAISALVITARFAAVFPLAYLRVNLRRRIGLPAEPTSWRRVFVVSWAGMRGVVTLAAALALPTTTAAGAPFPGRSLILFLAFVVIAVTLVGQGLTLPALMRRLRVTETAPEDTALALAQVRTAKAAQRRLHELEPDLATKQEREIAGRLSSALDERIAYFDAVLGGRKPDGFVPALQRHREMRLELCRAERHELERLRSHGEIDDRVYHHLEWQIDLLEAQLD
jgi:monovalent cation/hydrogen antiporter